MVFIPSCLNTLFIRPLSYLHNVFWSTIVETPNRFNVKSSLAASIIWHFWSKLGNIYIFWVSVIHSLHQFFHIPRFPEQSQPQRTQASWTSLLSQWTWPCRIYWSVSPVIQNSKGPFEPCQSFNYHRSPVALVQDGDNKVPPTSQSRSGAAEIKIFPVQ